MKKFYGNEWTKSEENVFNEGESNSLYVCGQYPLTHFLQKIVSRCVSQHLCIGDTKIHVKRRILEITIIGEELIAVRDNW